MNHGFKVDKEKCIKCGLCTNDCITSAIVQDENNYPFMKNPLNCIECQHCFSICPNGAISVLGHNPDDAQPIVQTNPDEILNLIKSRRSVRKYKKINVSKDTIQKLKEALNYVPTGCNNHSLHFSFIEDIEVMDDFRQKVNTKLISFLKNMPFKLGKLSNYKDAIIQGEDVIFRDAPHLVVVSAPINSPCPNQDGIIALSYFELYANSLGLGTLWCGFAQAILKIMGEFCEYLQIPKGYMPIYVMLFGYSSIKYPRTTIPTPYTFKTIEKQELDKSIFNKIKRTFWNFIR